MVFRDVIEVDGSVVPDRPERLVAIFHESSATAVERAHRMAIEQTDSPRLQAPYTLSPSLTLTLLSSCAGATRIRV